MIKLSWSFISRGFAVAALCAASGGLGVLLAAKTPAKPSPQNATATAGVSAKGQIVIPACGSGSGGYVATLGVLAPGHSSNELAAAGWLSAPAFIGSSGNVLVLYPKDVNAATGPSVSSPALQSSRPLRAQTSDSSLRSCWYDLHDNAAAAGIAAASVGQMLSENLIKQSDLSTSPLPVEMLTDNPYDPSELLFILALSGPPASKVLGEVTVTHESLVAFVDRTTRVVTGVAIANLYPIAQ